MAGDGDRRQPPRDDNWIESAAKSSAMIVWSRWTATVGIPIAIGVLWIAADRFTALERTAMRVSETQVVIMSRLERAEEDIRSIFSSRYTSADALRDQKTQTQIDTDQTRRITVIEGRIGGDFDR